LSCCCWLAREEGSGAAGSANARLPRDVRAAGGGVQVPGQVPGQMRQRAGQVRAGQVRARQVRAGQVPRQMRQRAGQVPRQMRQRAGQVREGQVQRGVPRQMRQRGVPGQVRQRGVPGQVRVRASPPCQLRLGPSSVCLRAKTSCVHGPCAP
jgi:hypothetical protein